MLAFSQYTFIQLHYSSCADLHILCRTIVCVIVYKDMPCAYADQAPCVQLHSIFATLPEPKYGCRFIAAQMEIRLTNLCCHEKSS